LVIFVAGLEESMRDPFSYKLRKNIILKSLKAYHHKIIVLPALIKQKNSKAIQTGYIKSLVNKIDALNYADAIFLFVGTDRYTDFSEQLVGIQKDNKAFDKVRVVNSGIYFNEFGKKIDSTTIRGAIMAGDTECLKKYLPPTVTENSRLFNNIYNAMKREVENTYDVNQFDKIVDKTTKEQS